jgi:class I fructose-bisphosphate aldolase
MRQFSRLAERADSWQMPLVGHIYPRGSRVAPAEQTSVEQVSYCARLGAELGADIVKTTYTGSSETFAEVVQSSPAYVAAAGGLDASDDVTYLTKAAEVVASGAVGVAFGRYVWQHPDPPGLIRALRYVVHDCLAPEKALLASGLTGTHPRGEG